LRPRFGEYLERARDGDEVVVLVHGQPAALLRPVRSNDAGALVPSRLVRDERIVAAKLAREEYLPLIASAVARAQVGVGAPGGIRTPDHLIRSPLPVRVSSESRFVRGTAIGKTQFSTIPG